MVLAIVANRSYRGKFVYELPENVSEVYELYLEDYDWVEQEKIKNCICVRMNMRHCGHYF